MNLAILRADVFEKREPLFATC